VDTSELEFLTWPSSGSVNPDNLYFSARATTSFAPLRGELWQLGEDFPARTKTGTGKNIAFDIPAAAGERMFIIHAYYGEGDYERVSTHFFTVDNDSLKVLTGYAEPALLEDNHVRVVVTDVDEVVHGLLHQPNAEPARLRLRDGLGLLGLCDAYRIERHARIAQLHRDG
jgi:hypothetical protein